MASAPRFSGNFQFEGDYYTFQPATNTGAMNVPPANPQNILVVDPQQMSATNTGMCGCANGVQGAFQFNGNYYSNNLATNQYCVLPSAPANAASLPVLNPQLLSTTNIGMCSGAQAPEGSFQFGGNYYYNYPPNNRSLPDVLFSGNASNLIVINPLQINTMNSGDVLGRSVADGLLPSWGELLLQLSGPTASTAL